MDDPEVFVTITDEDSPTHYALIDGDVIATQCIIDNAPDWSRGNVIDVQTFPEIAALLERL